MDYGTYKPLNNIYSLNLWYVAFCVEVGNNSWKKRWQGIGCRMFRNNAHNKDSMKEMKRRERDRKNWKDTHSKSQVARRGELFFISALTNVLTF